LLFCLLSDNIIINKWYKGKNTKEKSSNCLKMVIIALKFVRKVVTLQILLQIENYKHMADEK
jgi:hypothetical protein